MDNKRDKIINLLFDDATTDGEKLNCLNHLKKINGSRQDLSRRYVENEDEMTSKITTLIRKLSQSEQRNECLLLDAEMMREEVSNMRVYSKYMQCIMVAVAVISVVGAIVCLQAQGKIYLDEISQKEMKIRHLEYNLEREKTKNIRGAKWD